MLHVDLLGRSTRRPARIARRASLRQLEYEALESRIVLDSTFFKLMTIQHADLGFDYIGGQWEVSSEIGSNNPADPAVDYAPDQTLHYVHPGALTSRPGGAQWDFLGVPAGQQLYILPQNQNPNLLYLGTASEETPIGTFAPYTETDPRVTQIAPFAWQTIQVVAKRGPGEFSMWQSGQFGAPTVFVSTAEGGLTSSDKFFLIEGGHVHYNYGFTQPGFYEIDMQASGYLGPGQTNQTSSAVNTFYFSVDDELKVTSVTPTESGFLARFNRPIDLTTLNLYDGSAGSLGAADVTLVGDSVGPVRGSLVVPTAVIPVEADSATGQKERTQAINAVEFVRTGGPLVPDNYTVTLRSDNTTFAASTGFKTTATPVDTSILDGNGDGTTGDDYVGNFTVVSSTLPVLSVADFARGGGQAVAVPATAAGIPVTIDSTTINGHPITSVDAELVYDPELLTITGMTTTVSGWSATMDPSFATLSDGKMVAKFTVQGAPALTGTTPVTVGFVQASVPSDAPYADKQVLRLRNVTVFDNTDGLDVPIRGEDALHVAAFLGDADGSGTLSGGDASQVAQVGVGSGTGFTAYQNADPLLIADASNSGTVSGGDASLIAQKAVGLTVPQIPNAVAPVPGAGGPDPRLHFEDATGAPGDTVGVYINFEATETISPGLNSIDVAVSWDPAKFTMVGSPTLGSYLAGLPGWLVGAFNYVPAEGTLRITGYTSNPQSTTPLGAGGRAITFDLQVDAGAPSGPSSLNLRQNVETTYTGAENNNGLLTLIPAPTNAGNDVNVDGVFTITTGGSSASILGREIFYNGSKFDGFSTAINASDDAAIATDKSAYLPGSGPSTFSNITSYTRGINGVMVDIANPAGTLTVADFTFKMSTQVGASNTPSTWAAAPAPTAFSVRPGAGVSGSDRVEIVWADGAIANRWLEVIVEGNDAIGGSNTNTGLAESDIFFFGNRIGDTGSGTPTLAITSAADEIAARNNAGFGSAITNLYDFDRTGLVNAVDQIAARNNGGFLTKINITDPPAAPAVSGGANRANVAVALASPEPSIPGLATWSASVDLVGAAVDRPIDRTVYATRTVERGEAIDVTLAVFSAGEDPMEALVSDDLLDELIG
ncbi:MAG: hypothetical protein DWQ37_06390 [Planctomycetota bacterium]|nr:MAG: hypothetical protein DWQ37_06390 [Planctomycetota bacterium]